MPSEDTAGMLRPPFLSVDEDGVPHQLSRAHHVGKASAEGQSQGGDADLFRVFAKIYRLKVVMTSFVRAANTLV